MQIGDKVEWTHVSQRGRSVSMALRSGTIEAIGGALATVRTPSRKRAVIALNRLRLAGAPSQIQEFVEGIRDVAQPSNECSCLAPEVCWCGAYPRTTPTFYGTVATDNPMGVDEL